MDSCWQHGVSVPRVCGVMAAVTGGGLMLHSGGQKMEDGRWTVDSGLDMRTVGGHELRRPFGKEEPRPGNYMTA